MKVLLFGSYAPSLVGFRGPLIADMVAAGHEVFAMAPDIDEASAAAIRTLGAEPVEVPLARTSLNPLGMLRNARAIRRAAAAIRPDVLIAYTIKPVILGSRLKVPTFVPMITGLGYAFLGTGGLKRALVRAAAERLYRRALKRAKVVIFQNPDDLADFKRLGILDAATPTAIVNGSGVDLDQFAQAPLPPEPHFLMIARLLRDKGVREFATAAARLKRERPNVHVSLAGWLDESPDTITQTELDAMQESGVTYLGRLDDVRPALAAASVYVLPSYREGTPRSVLEAMAVGRAIITTDAPGCRETVEQGVNGFLVPPRDADSLYDAMMRFVRDPSLAAKMGPQSRRIAEQRYDVRAVNADLLRIAGL